MDVSGEALFGGFRGGRKPIYKTATPPLPLVEPGGSGSEHPILVKEGVVFKRFLPEILHALPIISSVFNQRGKETIITSGNDGVHKHNSRHYRDMAIDLRSHHLLDGIQRHLVFEELKARLGIHYLVLFENEGAANEHFHIAGGY
jgi:hypothetical protein